MVSADSDEGTRSVTLTLAMMSRYFVQEMVSLSL